MPRVHHVDSPSSHSLLVGRLLSACLLHSSGANKAGPQIHHEDSTTETPSSLVLGFPPFSVLRRAVLARIQPHGQALVKTNHRRSSSARHSQDRHICKHTTQASNPLALVARLPVFVCIVLHALLSSAQGRGTHGGGHGTNVPAGLASLPCGLRHCRQDTHQGCPSLFAWPTS